MDLLGSILSSMDAPPPISEREKMEKKRQEDMIKKIRDEERDRLNSLRDGIEDIIDDFLQNTKLTRIKLEPMEKIARKIVHEAAENVGLVAYTFGPDEGSTERYVMLFKKEGAPSDAELSCLRSGRTWDPEAAAKSRREQASYELPSIELRRANKRRAPGSSSPDAYRKKYERIVGSELAASKVTVTKNQYGFGECTLWIKR